MKRRGRSRGTFFAVAAAARAARAAAPPLGPNLALAGLSRESTSDGCAAARLRTAGLCLLVKASDRRRFLPIHTRRLRPRGAGPRRWGCKTSGLDGGAASVELQAGVEGAANGRRRRRGGVGREAGGPRRQLYRPGGASHLCFAQAAGAVAAARAARDIELETRNCGRFHLGGHPRARRSWRCFVCDNKIYTSLYMVLTAHVICELGVSTAHDHFTKKKN